jgi:hypothetical protein
MSSEAAPSCLCCVVPSLSMTLQNGHPTAIFVAQSQLGALGPAVE